jgi:hypothetical protein
MAFGLVREISRLCFNGYMEIRMLGVLRDIVKDLPKKKGMCADSKILDLGRTSIERLESTRSLLRPVAPVKICLGIDS